jgi:hypothetical protein
MREIDEIHRLDVQHAVAIGEVMHQRPLGFGSILLRLN